MRGRERVYITEEKSTHSYTERETERERERREKPKYERRMKILIHADRLEFNKNIFGQKENRMKRYTVCIAFQLMEQV